jgi:membrane-bound inhibitor of C-type lysozyme
MHRLIVGMFINKSSCCSIVKSMKKHMKLVIIFVATILLVIAVIVFVSTRSHTPVSTSQLIATVAYACSSQKFITAQYYQGEHKPSSAGDPPIPTGSVVLTLSDGRVMTLSQTRSADGGRYANKDETTIFWNKGRGGTFSEKGSTTSCIEVPQNPGGLWEIYASSTSGFALRYPNGFRVDTDYHYQELGPEKVISGVKFIIPRAMESGTNLGADTYLSVEQLSDVASCSALLFLPEGKEFTTLEEGMTYSVASSTGAGAGNRYEETVFAFPGTNPCIGVRYFIHYGVIENYPIGIAKTFDRGALLALFDATRRSILIAQ